MRRGAILLISIALLVLLGWQVYQAADTTKRLWREGPVLDFLEFPITQDLLERVACDTHDSNLVSLCNSVGDTVVLRTCSRNMRVVILLHVLRNMGMKYASGMDPFDVQNGRIVSKQGFPFDRNLELVSSNPAAQSGQLYYFISGATATEGNLASGLRFSNAEEIQFSLDGDQLFYALRFNRLRRTASGSVSLHKNAIVIDYSSND